MARYMHPATKLLNECEQRKGIYVINIDTAEREFVPFAHPRSEHQMVISSICTHIKSAISSESITFGEFKQKYPNINEFVERMKGRGFRTFS